MTELRRGTPVVVGDVTIVPVEEVSVQSWTGARGFGVSAFKRPVAVVVSVSNGTRIFELTTENLQLTQLLDSIT